jgi:hypothetical protein
MLEPEQEILNNLQPEPRKNRPGFATLLHTLEKACHIIIDLFPEQTFIKSYCAI